MVILKMMMAVEDDSASSVKGGGVFLLFRGPEIESTVVFEENMRTSQEYTSNFPQAIVKGREVSQDCGM